MSAPTTLEWLKRLVVRPETVTATLLGLALFAGAIQSPYFMDAGYLLDASTLYVETGLVALGMTFVIVCGQIDLSVASNVTLTACLVAMTLRWGWPAPAALAMGPALGAALGALNGVITARSRLPSFVVTLATMALFRGIAQILLGQASATVPKQLTGFDRLGYGPVPLSLAILLLCAGLLWLSLHRGLFGRWVVAVGANEEAALFAGIPVGRVKVLVFTLAGLMCGLAALHMVSRLGVARFDLARGLELDAITAVVLGGASIFGGRGSIAGTMLALFLLATLKTGMGLANVKAEYQLAVVGTILIVAVAMGNIVFRERTRMAR
jgi:rhamnose transport system permease protein